MVTWCASKTVLYFLLQRNLERFATEHYAFYELADEHERTKEATTG
jgi:hypothetical protein